MTTVFDRIAGMTAPQRTALTEKFQQATRLSLAEPVAVVGIGCRFPGDVDGPESYWNLLTEGRDAVGEIPVDRWDADAYYDPDPTVPGRMATKWGGFLDDVAGFDADFFGITPREAEAMDPQQRVLLEVAWEALEHAGIPTDSLSGTQTAVMMGVYYNEYQSASAAAGEAVAAYSATGNAHSVTVGRIAYLLGLRGPAVAIDTACSSSLVAIHLACQSLRLRESDLALAGGVSLMLRPETQIALSSWGMFSPEGRCKTFDAAADGFVRGEGCGVVVLKRLTDAVRDGDRVLAVVRGSAVNQDGRSNGMTAPNAPSQTDVINAALRTGDMTANSVNYVETHGTGTALGDPIEFEALAATYGQGDGPCALGAVKTNLGHLEAAAGIAGFIKATLALQRGRIPRNLHFTQWNPAIDATGTRLFVPTTDQPWPASSGPRRAAVSGFGFGGTNAHVVLEQGPEPVVVAGGGAGAVTTLVVSGKSGQRVASSAGALGRWLAGAGSAVGLADVAHTLNHHRARSAVFGSVVARDRAAAVAGLAALAAGGSAPGVVGPHVGACRAGTVFVYSGQGSQWAGMGAALLAEEPAFAAAVAELEPVFVDVVGFSLQQVLAGGESVAGIERIQPVLVGVQLALTALWRSYGVSPDAVIGHSMGEVTAAVVAGALTVAEGLTVIAVRSQLMSRLAGQGAMALVELDAGQTSALLAAHPQVSLAVYASARQSVIAGPPEAVDAVCAVVAAGNRLARRVEVDVASHHRIVDPILAELGARLAGLAPRAPRIPVFSTTGDQDSGVTPVFDAGHWVDNLRNPVRFHQAVEAAGRTHGTFIEISPHPLLTHAITDTLTHEVSAGRALVTSTMERDEDSALFLHTQLAAVRAPSAEPAGDGRLVDLPTTPWQHSHYWVADRSAALALGAGHPLLGTHVEMPSGREHVWQGDVGTEMWPWLADHQVHGQPILPAAAFAELALAAATEALDVAVDAVAVRQLEIEQMLPLAGRVPITTQLTRDADDIRVEIHSRSANGAWRRHAVARIDAKPGRAPERTAPAADPSDAPLAPADFYTALRRTGQHHGPAFAALTRIVRSPRGGAESEITLPDEASRHPGYRIHPVMLDAALQGMAAAMADGALAGSAETTYLPVSFESVRVFGDVGRHAVCRAELSSLDEAGAGMLGNLTLWDAAGRLTAEVSGIYVRRVERRAVPLPLTQKTFGAEWQDSPIADLAGPSAPTNAPGSWLLLADSADMKDLAEDFAAKLRSADRRVLNGDLADEAGVLEAFADAGADPDRPPMGVVVFVGHTPFADTDTDTDADAALVAVRDTIWSITAAVRAVVGGWHGAAPRLWLVTRDGLIVDDDEAGDPAVGALRGLVRVLGYEHTDLRAKLIDLDATHDVLARLRVELDAPGTDDVVAWRGERRYVERLARATLEPGDADAVVRADGAYLLTGGLGGLGLVVARWLVDHGAGRVVLNGRSEPSDEQLSALSELQSRADVTFVRGDIAAPDIARELVAAAEATGLALRGVLHSAAVIDDGLLIAMSRESLDRVWLPKATGALRLHQATAGRELDWWVGFSSLASLLGSPGQGAYATANAWLDSLVGWRRAAGLPATAINWGQWAQVGAAQSLTLSVLDPMAPAEGTEALEQVLAAKPGQIGVARLRLDRALAAFPEIRGLGYFTDVVRELDELGEGGSDWAGPDALRDLDPADARQAVADRLRSRVLAIMGYPDDWTVDETTPVIELGIDSLMAVRIRNSARADFGVEPSVALLLQGASLRDVTADLNRQLGLADDDGTADRADVVRDRAQQRAAARQGAALRRRRGQRA